MAITDHKITAPIGVELIQAETDEDSGEHGLHIIAWAEEAWPDYVAIEDRITGRIRIYAGGGFDADRYRKTVRLLEEAIATMAAWGAMSDE